MKFLDRIELKAEKLREIIPNIQGHRTEQIAAEGLVMSILEDIGEEREILKPGLIFIENMKLTLYDVDLPDKTNIYYNRLTTRFESFYNNIPLAEGYDMKSINENTKFNLMAKIRNEISEIVNLKSKQEREEYIKEVFKKLA
jgi:hypothetical protein